MLQNRLHPRIIISALTAALIASTPICAFAQVAPASPAEKKEEVVVLPTFTLTGSLIKRVDDAKVIPVLTLDSDYVSARDAVTPIELLSSVPQVMNTPLAESANNSFSARGDFDAINLRGIGSGNTLILLNGRRLAPHPIASTDENGTPSSAVNVNQLPTNGVQRTEVLLDGASSIYGTDAVAGVVNYITNINYQGTEVGLRYSQTKYQDGDQVKVSITNGNSFAGGRGHYMATFDYFHREPIYSRNRPAYATQVSWPLNRVLDAPAPWNDPNSTFIPLASNPYFALSAQSTFPAFKVGSTTNYLSPLDGPSAPPTLTTVTPVRGGAGYAFYGTGYGLLGPGNTLLPRSNRYNFYSQAEFNLKSGITAFGEVSYYRALSVFSRQPPLFNAGALTDNAIVIPVGTPNNPFSQPVTFLTRSLADLGPEQDVVLDTVGRILGGFRGKIGTSDWTWETAAYYTEAKVNDTAHNAVRESLFDQAVISGAYNPYGYTLVNNGGVVTVGPKVGNQSAAIATFTSDWIKNGSSSIASIDAQTSGSLFNIWGGAIQMALGSQYRVERFDFSMPPFDGLNPVNLGPGLGTDNNDFLLFGPAANWTARRDVTSAYAETVIPLIARSNKVPLAQSLNVTASARSEKSSDYGSATKPKVGMDWKPFSWLMFRASYNLGYRAPNLPSLNGGQRKTTLSVTDPVNNNINQSYWSIIQGNPNLKPERSQGKSVGVVIDIPYVKGLSLNVDYWEVRQHDLVTTPVTANILLNDAQLLAPIVAANPGVPFSQLPFKSGTSGYLGNPNVIRNSDNTLYGVVGQIFNAATGFASGTDINLTYRLPKTQIGLFTFNTGWAYLGQSYIYASATALKDNRNNLLPNARWHGSASLTWKKNGWSAGVSGFLIGGAQTSTTLPVATAAQIAQSEALWQALGQPSYIEKGYNLGSIYYRRALPSIISYNTFASYEFAADRSAWLKNTSIRLGVDNFTNAQQPFGGNGTGGAGALGLYNGIAPGVTYVISLKHQF